MRREQFHELVTRAAEICSPEEPIIFGSQAVHAVTTTPPAEVLVSVECDIWIRGKGIVAERLTKELGKESSFARDKGVYADVLPPDLPTLPQGWEERLVSYRAGGITARCLEIHDLIVSKLAAGRLKDYEFIASGLIGKLARLEELQRRLERISDTHVRAILLARLRIATESSDISL